MSQYLLLKGVEVQNANAISGMTWGFPSPTHFLGFAHALSRKLKVETSKVISLGGVAIVCHSHEVQAQKPGGYESVFSLTRDPLTKDGKTAPFNEEGRMHMTVSLIIEVNGEAGDINLDHTIEENRTFIINRVKELALRQRLAGGVITSIKNVSWVDTVNFDRKKLRRMMLRLLPGFVLQDRTDSLIEHHESLTSTELSRDMLDSLLDFISFQSVAVPDKDTEDGRTLEEGDKCEWSLLPKPQKGWFVPVSIGYKAISEVYDPGTVKNARDNETPFCFVESAYGLGQWMSPHRVEDLKDIIWSYSVEDDLYLCRAGRKGYPATLEDSEEFVL